MALGKCFTTHRRHGPPQAPRSRQQCSRHLPSSGSSNTRTRITHTSHTPHTCTRWQRAARGHSCVTVCASKFDSCVPVTCSRSTLRSLFPWRQCRHLATAESSACAGVRLCLCVCVCGCFFVTHTGLNRTALVIHRASPPPPLTFHN